MDIDDPNDDMEIKEEEEDQDDHWPAWDHAVPNNVANVNGNQIPQHPNVPQHFIDLDLSGSSMRFLRAQGPDIAIEEVF